MTEKDLEKLMEEALKIVGATAPDFIRAALESVDIVNDVGTPQEVLQVYINWLREAH